MSTKLRYLRVIASVILLYLIASSPCLCSKKEFWMLNFCLLICFGFHGMSVQTSNMSFLAKKKGTFKHESSEYDSHDTGLIPGFDTHDTGLIPGLKQAFKL